MNVYILQKLQLFICPARVGHIQRPQPDSHLLRAI